MFEDCSKLHVFEPAENDENYENAENPAYLFNFYLLTYSEADQ